ncbi:MAM and LDL-receptor class A domain-containing protein 1-like [Diadema antillarum]|uniref:MAM and LDL-receptor class A domain-containing protein 1-like n=1 Tax=Diadema antillarum TaxID=105358 RepID=UPI003A8BAEF4
MYGATIGSLRIYVSKQGDPIGSPVFQMSGTQGTDWILGQVDITRQDADRFVVTIEGVVGTDFTGDIAIDDVQIYSGYCPQVVVTPSPSSIPAIVQCDFEDPAICGFYQDVSGTDDFDWQRQSANTPSSDTGPPNDHTYGTSAGYYMYIESSSPQVLGDEARLWTPSYPAAGGHCVEFYYHMYGSSIGTLNVYVVQSGGSVSQSLPAWSRSADQGNEWYIARFVSTIPTYQVVFEGVVGSSFTSDIAIDDFRITDGTCLAQGDCDFEDDLCTWTNDVTSDDFDWIRKQASAGTPSTDHTLGTAAGYYLYLDTTNQSPGNSARLVSSLFTAAPGTRRCVTFWYYIEGVDSGAIVVAQEISGQPDVIRWRLDSTQGSSWNYGQLPVSQDNDYRLVFQGAAGSSTTGTIAVDDVIVTDNNCPVRPYSADIGPTFPPSSPIPTTAPHIVIPAGPANCDFEGGLCSYVQSGSDGFDWTRNSGPTPTQNTGPSDDHTHAGSISIAGSYMYTEADTTTVGQTARLNSALYSPVTSDSCLTFWYHMHGQNVGTLNVLTSSGSAETVHWTRSGTHGDQWLVARVPFSGTQTYSVVFEAVMTGDPSSDMAIDDILLENQDCLAVTPSPGAFSPMCDFEYGFATCGYSQESVLDDFDWSLGTGPQGPSTSGPSSDHTTGTAGGKYMYIDTAAPRVPGEKAWLYSHTFPAAGSHCLEFYYHMYGGNIGSLSMLVEVGGLLSSPYFTLSGQLGDQWNVARVPLAINDDFQVYFEATVGDGALGNIALDDIDMYAGSCLTPGDCDFESGFCTWTNDPTGDMFDWILGSGGTPSIGTGPSVDHTLGTALGTFVFIETSSPQVFNDAARLRSQAFSATPSGGRCLRFWYHMYGTQIGSLHIYLETVVFEGIVGQGFEGDIALDDLMFVESYCGVLPPQADPRPPSLTTLDTGTGLAVVHRHHLVGPSVYSCDFEAGFCTFTQATDDGFDWTRNSGETTSTYTGPATDHTLGTVAGFYIYTEASNNFNNIARLESALIPASVGKICAQFWYHMWGADMGTLSVYAKVGSSLGPVLWSRSGSLSRKWYNAQVEFIPTTDYKFVFEGVTGTNFDSDIALDDIFITNGDCPGFHTCGFEDSSLCGYAQDTTDDFDWSWTAGSTATPYTGPSVDVTMGTAYGHYVYINAATQQPGKTARLVTPYFDPATTGETEFCWTFFYHMFGDQMGALSVMLEGDPQPLWTQSTSDLGDTWFFASVNVSSSAVFRLVFEATVGSGPRSDIAIDDVDYQLSPCGAIGSCDFESSMCMWKNVDGDDFDWLRLQGTTPSTGTGPNVDHTLGTSFGSYMFIEASSPRLASEVAHLFLSSPDLTGQRCLGFWYMMFGVDTGQLLVYGTTGAALLSSEILWSLSGQQNVDQNTWLYGQVTVDFDAINEVYLVAVLTSVPYGDTSIDDIVLTEGSCDTLPASAVPSVNTGSASCDFEINFCRYTQDPSSDFAWSRLQGPTSSVNTGPSGDHTSGSDMYNARCLTKYNFYL